MIFAKTANLVLSGRKSQTLRLAHVGDSLRERSPGVVGVFTSDGRPRWVIGHSYAVQRERCHSAVGRIVVTYLREVLNPLEAGQDPAFLSAEGFDDPAVFLSIWHELHRKQTIQRCWAIGFKLEKSA